MIGTVQNPAIRAFAASTGIDLASLEAPDATERWRIQFLDTKENNTHATVLLCGSDAHGAMWAVYEFCERILGIDPLYLWTDSPPPPPAGAFHIPRSAIRTHEDQPHTFRYRGWFINDEDLLCGWRDGGGHRTIDYPYYHQVVHPGVMARVVETALRLKQNLLIPASFLDIDNPAEEALVRLATERGLHISQHHIEPLGVSHFAMERYWRARGRATPPSYVTEPDLVRETWRHYATRWARHPGVVWQLGLRGRGDRPVWENDSHVPPTMEARGALISRAIADQHAIVAEVLGRDDFVSTTTLWQEGTVLHNAGHLHFPPKTLILFADTLQTPRAAGGQPFYAQRWGADFHSVARQPRHAYGIYYHVAVWRSGPHLAQGVPPAKIQHAVGEAVTRGDTALAITNVANLREVVLGIRAMAALTWDFAAFDHDAFMRDWCARQFGNDAAPDAIRLYQDFHDAMPPLPAGDSAHPALYHDGALRESGLVCLEAMQRFATSTDAPSPSLPILDVGCSTLDVRRSGHRPAPPPPPWLENFTPQTLQNLTTWTAHGLARWPAVIANARALASRIPPERASFFHHHFIVQAAIMLGLNQWLAALLQAFRALSEAPPLPPLAADGLHAAADALDRAIATRAASETGVWRHWYRGDHKINLSALASQTRRLADALAQKHQPELVTTS
ncbi:glycosyl hydrolase 115 family protein [Geminisphaera colitermitum]|uniref:glycosyl hydrolase 115 family protein n=1 Tax=Geminisphaera colitermitum TaxID=1148786 RepID=UPI0002F867CD|nr:glycosyl hydrolase 115 family protein [Geminisphaera colitermitum]